MAQDEGDIAGRARYAYLVGILGGMSSRLDDIAGLLRGHEVIMSQIADRLDDISRHVDDISKHGHGYSGGLTVEDLEGEEVVRKSERVDGSGREDISPVEAGAAAA